MADTPQSGTSSDPYWGPPTKSDIAASQQRPENQASTYGGGNDNATTLHFTAPGRTIFGLMFFAVAFSLVGHEITTLSKSPTKAPATGTQIIIGGFAATTVLILISHAGDAGEQLGVGLALITTVASLLVFGAPVWEALAKAVGGGKKSTATTPTTPTVPTTGTKTTTSLAQVA